jgi:hypothetical protein
MIAQVGEVLGGSAILTGWQVVQIGFFSLLYLAGAQRFFRLDPNS